jgi:hypothetical protein
MIAKLFFGDAYHLLINGVPAVSGDILNNGDSVTGYIDGQSTIISFDGELCEVSGSSDIFHPRSTLSRLQAVQGSFAKSWAKGYGSNTSLMLLP